MAKKRFILIDWAGNHLHTDKTFKSFEDGWEFIDANYPEEDFEELLIIPQK